MLLLSFQLMSRAVGGGRRCGGVVCWVAVGENKLVCCASADGIKVQEEDAVLCFGAGRVQLINKGYSVFPRG